MTDTRGLSRRDFLRLTTAAGAFGAAAASGATLPLALRTRHAGAAPMQLAGSSLAQFVDPLPLLSVAGGPIHTIVAGASEITLSMQEFRATVMPSTFVPASGNPYAGTWVWGYREGTAAPSGALGTYTGPVIVATRHIPTQIRFVNNLVAEHIAWRDWTDQTLHWADPLNGGANMCNHMIEPGQPPTMGCGDHYEGPIPAVPHLHGGEVPPVIDGGPESWFTASGGYQGFAYYTFPGMAAAANEAVYRYPNSQEAAMIWYHDHLLGGTRLNVYAGLAGAYPLIDPGLTLPTGLHPVGLQQGASGPVDPLVPMVVQDRAFDTEGQLFFANTGINPEHPFWIPEFEGDSIVVNGKVWPFLNVEPRRYRFLFINGSNARTYEMFLTDAVTKAMGPPIWQIGTDGGYLDAPVKIDPNAPKPNLTKLVIMPGERADVIVDFAGLASGTTLLLHNVAKFPYPGGASPKGSTMGRIMQVRVGPGSGQPDLSYNPASGIPLRPSMVRLVNPAAGTLAVTPEKIRLLTLNEIQGPGGPLEVLVNNSKWDGKREDGSTRSDFTPVTVGGTTEYYSELPAEGTTEEWDIVNLTEDAHPIHTHLTQFQIINRQAFDTDKYEAAYTAAFPSGDFEPASGPPLDYNTGNPTALGGNPDVAPFLKGPIRPPKPNEAGWKDTAQMFPGEVTRIAVRFAPTDTPAGTVAAYPFNPNAPTDPGDESTGHGYVWHCHIVDHEDNEMMRPTQVQPQPGATRSYVQGEDY